MTYGEIKTMIKEYLHRDDLIAYIPTWVKWVHSFVQKNKIFRYQQCEFDPVTLDENINEYDLYSDFTVNGVTTKCKKIGHILIEKTTTGERVCELAKKEYPYFEEAFRKIMNGNTEYPVIYTRWQNKIRIMPAGNNNYRMLLLGYRELPFYSSDSDSDYLSEYYPQLLVIGALAYAAPFIKDKKDAEYWQEVYMQHYQAYLQEESVILRGQANVPK